MTGSLPDRKNLLLKLAEDPNETLEKWMRRLNLNDSPVLSTMWPCIILNSRVTRARPESLPADNMKEDAREMQRARRKVDQ